MGSGEIPGSGRATLGQRGWDGCLTEHVQSAPHCYEQVQITGLCRLPLAGLQPFGSSCENRTCKQAKVASTCKHRARFRQPNPSIAVGEEPGFPWGLSFPGLQVSARTPSWGAQVGAAQSLSRYLVLLDELLDHLQVISMILQHGQRETVLHPALKRGRGREKERTFPALPEQHHRSRGSLQGAGRGAPNPRHSC